MKRIRALSLLLLLLLLTSLFGCALPPLPTFPVLPDGEEVTFTPTVYTEVTKTAFEGCYADQLSPNERCIYDKILTLAPGECEVTLSLTEQPALCQGREPTETETDDLSKKIGYWAANALYAVWLDHPELFWIEYGSYSYSYKMESDAHGIVRMTELTLTLPLPDGMTAPAQLAEALEQATKDFDPPENAPLTGKIAYINDYLKRKITYELNAPNRGNVIGALVDRRCVCEGYAHAFTLLAKRAGLDAVSIPGYGTTDEGTEGHMWNAVRIDGALYAIDVTWNDSTRSSEYFLVGTSTVCKGVPFGESHTPDMLTLDDSHKRFALPAIAENAYRSNQ